ncbi:MAG: amino acid ABC transporter permease [Clostridiales bacterium]|nr:amino acid ABC transporter permease [Clostridiales bacterium]
MDTKGQFDLVTGWNSLVEQLITNKGYLKVLAGLRDTAIIAVAGLVIGIIIGTLLAVTKVVPQKRWYNKMFSRLTDVYVALFRGTPMVVQLLIMFYVLFPLIGLSGVPSLVVAIVAFGMNSGAYVSEIMRSGILSVDKGQMEAGRALGLGYYKTMTNIVLPQAVKNIFPTLGNEFIALVKETSVVSFIAITDLTKAFQDIASSSYEYLITYLALALCYLVIVFLITICIRLLERRLRASERK